MTDTSPARPAPASTLAEALDALPDAVSVRDYEFRVLYLNRVAEGHLRAIGRDPADVRG